MSGQHRATPGKYRYFIGVTLGDAAVSLHFSALAGELAARGHEVLLLTDQERRELEDPGGNPAVRSWPSRRPTQLRDARFFADLARRTPPDCVLANFSSVSLMLSMGFLLGVPKRVAWYHTPSGMIDVDATTAGRRLALALRRYRRRAVYRSATHVVAVSAATRHDLLRTFRVRPERTSVQYNAIGDPLVEFPVLRTPRVIEPRLVCVGRLLPVKGQDVLLRALARLAPTHPGLRLELIGAGEARDRLVALAQDLGVADRCEFAGARSRAHVLARMAGAAATVVPSFDEGCPMVIVESLALGTPVVASAVGGIPEMVDEGVEGLLVPPGDSAVLAGRLARVLDDPSLRAALADRARPRFLARFERVAAVERQADWLEKLVRGADGVRAYRGGSPPAAPAERRRPKLHRASHGPSDKLGTALQGAAEYVSAEP